ncbi:MAG: T9SS type A sorting domain-containing protein [Thermonemataceae bacterium]|nr:T9SS type A sorting domain-containing protein [Thermonemataceae bacterium]
MKRQVLLYLILFYGIIYTSKAQTITVTGVSPTSTCAGDNIAVTFTKTGTFNSGNYFTVQLSDVAGNFTSPTDIGTLISTGAGTITATIPLGTPSGSGYRVRIVSSDPAVTSPTATPIITVATVTGDPTVFGSSEWIVYGYDGDIFAGSPTYRGFYTHTSLNFNTSTRWGITSSPSFANATGGAAYVGCSIPVDNHSFSYKRTNFTCAYYQVDIVHYDKYEMYVDGVLVAANTGRATRNNRWRGILGANSEVEIRTFDSSIPDIESRLQATFTVLTPETIAVLPVLPVCATSTSTINLVNSTSSLTVDFRIPAQAANYNFSWSGPAGFVTNASGTSLTTAPGAAGIYTLTATHTNGCVFTANFDVGIASAPVVVISPVGPITACPAEPTTLTASGATTYKWFVGASATSFATTASVTVSPTTTTTYRVEGSDGCSTSTQTVTVNVVANPADPGTFGSAEWFVACYQGTNTDFSLNRYFGYYTETNLSFNTTTRWAQALAPSDANATSGAAYTSAVSCNIPIDNHSYAYRRTNFTCGYYRITMRQNDDRAYIFINGTQVWQRTTANNTVVTAWEGFLGPVSTVEVRAIEGGGSSRLIVDITDITATIIPPVTSPTSVTICETSSTNITTAVLPIAVLYNTDGSFNSNVGSANVSFSQTTGSVGDFTITPSGSNATVTANATPTPNPATIRVTFTDPLTSCSINQDVQITVDPLPSTAANAFATTICVGENTTLIGTGANTYEWYDAAVGGTLVGTGASLVLSPTTTTTYRVEGNNNCATISATVTVTVVPKGAPPLTGTEYGDGEWIAHSYNGLLLTNPAAAVYRGYYTEKSLSFNSNTRWNTSTNPTNALALGDGSAAYSGCTVNNDNHSVSWRRTNFPCGNYNISVGRDERYHLYVNGILVSSSTIGGYSSNVWSGLLDASSTVELVTQETTSTSYGQISIGFSLGSATTSIWTGSVDSDWFNPFNWCPSIPTDLTDAIIPGGGVINFPIVNAAGAECKNLQVALGATLTINSGFGLDVHGDYLQEGALVAASNSTVRMLHNATPTDANILITGAGSFGNLLIDKVGSVVNLQSSIFVDNVLTLENGELNLNNNSLGLDNSSLGAIVRNNTSFIRSETNSATNNSRICWNMGSTTGAFVFPFGVSVTEYIPVTFNKQTNASSVICLSTRATLATDNTPWTTGVSNMVGISGATAENDVIDRWWDISSTVNPLPAPGADITFRYRGVENTIASSQTDNLAVQHWNGSDWEAPYSSGSPGVTSGIGSVTATGLRDFSPFVISRELKPLPVNLLSFRALGKRSVVLLEWSLAKSVIDEYYTLERSSDGRVFEAIAEVKSNGSSSYSYVDKSPYLGQVSYYRLKRRDDKGGLAYSQIEAVNMGLEVFEGLQAVPNPSESGLVFLVLRSPLEEKYQVEIVDALGREVYRGILETDTNGVGELIIRELRVSGVYVARVRGSSKIYQTKIVVK